MSQIHLAVLGHSFLASHHGLAADTMKYLEYHPRISSHFVCGISGLTFDKVHRLQEKMDKDDYHPNSIFLLMGDNDIAFRSGNIKQSTASFHRNRQRAVQTFEEQVGKGRVCSTVPFPRFQKDDQDLLYFDIDSPYNVMAGHYIRQLSRYRPSKWLPCVHQQHRVPFCRGRRLFPDMPPDESLYLFKEDGIHPAIGSFDALLRPCLDEWISRL